MIVLIFVLMGYLSQNSFVLTEARTHGPGCSTPMFSARCYTTQLSRRPICFAYVEWATILLVWSNPNLSNRRSVKQWYLPLLWWVFSAQALKSTTVQLIEVLHKHLRDITIWPACLLHLCSYYINGAVVGKSSQRSQRYLPYFTCLFRNK